MNLFVEDFRTVSDIVFTDVRIIDGTGALSSRGHVSVKGGEIEEASRNEVPNTGEVVDVGGAVLAPGFIEARSHSDPEVFEDPFLTLKLYQGIMTEIFDQDDLGPAPASPGRIDK